MTLATLLLALAVPAGTVSGTLEDPKQDGGLLQDLEIMRRLVARRVAEHSAQISGTTHFGWTDSNTINTLGTVTNLESAKGFTVEDQDSVLKTFANIARPGAAASYGARADYLPGYGAVFSLTVPIRLQWVASEKPQETDPQAVEDEWDRIQREVENPGQPPQGPDGVPILGQIPLLSHLFTAERLAQGGHLELSEEALVELETVLLETLGRFGHKLDLLDDESIAITVKLDRGPTPTATTALALADPALGLALAEKERTVDAWYLGGGRMVGAGRVEGPSRLVIQIAAKTARAVASGRIDLEELAGSARIDLL